MIVGISYEDVFILIMVEIVEMVKIIQLGKSHIV